MKKSPRIRITGDKSRPPRFGNNRLIKPSAGSVSLKRVSATMDTKEFCALITLKINNQFKIT